MERWQVCRYGNAMFYHMSREQCEVANGKAISLVRQDKEREATDGHDGTWVAHPGLVPIARQVFDECMPTPNQLHKQLESLLTTKADLTAIPEGTRTEAGFRHNISVTLGKTRPLKIHGIYKNPYFQDILTHGSAVSAASLSTTSWKTLPQQKSAAPSFGNGSSTTRDSKVGAEGAIGCESLRFSDCDRVFFADGRTVDAQLVKQTIAAETERRLIRAGSVVSRLPEAAELLEKFALEENMSDFLTLDAYDKLVSEGH
ncbi:hypothetical protein Y032_0003g1173 [Ancylostoma ceylanicum]|uniref:malate synthase n=1 Tax=Ancylostoma ceylanicum TaxID=53326 RepID=A0A016VVP1_9BILA|nr:hypothetical protein Y032_0003g1173 [Ancylostoma ceylanicum]